MGMFRALRAWRRRRLVARAVRAEYMADHLPHDFADEWRTRAITALARVAAIDACEGVPPARLLE